MRRYFAAVMLSAAVASVLWTAGSGAASDPSDEPKIDPAPCFAAADKAEPEPIITSCGSVIDSE